MTKSSQRTIKRIEKLIRRCERLQLALRKLSIPRDAPVFENPEIIRTYAEARAPFAKAGKRASTKP